MTGLPYGLALKLRFAGVCGSIKRSNSPGTVRGYDGRVYEVTDIKDTSYGLPDGLWGINCHHSPANVFIPGMSDVHGVENMPDEEENRRMYALDQEKKKYEREARLYGREKKMLKAAGDEEGAKAAAAKEKRARERARAAERERAVFDTREGYNLSVHDALFTSDGYHDLYMGITGNDIVDERVYEEAKKILAHRRDTVYEDVVLIDMDTGDLIARLDTDHTRYGATYTEEFVQSIQEAKKRGTRILAIHNHPNSFPPSLDDGSSACKHGYDLGVVCCHDGSVYTYTKTVAEYSYELLENVHNIMSTQACAGNRPIDSEWSRMLKLYRMEMDRRR